MEFVISSKTLDSLEEVVRDSHIKLLEKVHKKFLSDLDFEELIKMVDGDKKIEFIMKNKEEKEE
jgi:hypothetical protein